MTGPLPLDQIPDNGGYGGISPDEVRWRRNGTREMIKGNPISIVLLRPNRIDDNAGGSYAGTPVPQTAQEFRIIAQDLRVPVVRTVDGTEVQPQYVLLGYYDANILRGDTFQLAGIEYTVVWVEPDRLDATRAVLRYGT